MIESTAIDSNLFNVQNQGVDSLKNVEKAKDKESLKKAAQEFEAVFITKLMDIMESTVEKNHLMGSGRSEEMFKSLMHQELATNMASNPSSSFGLAKQLYEQMEKLV